MREIEREKEGEERYREGEIGGGERDNGEREG